LRRPLAASSDEPSTVSVNPFVALYALVTRKNKLGQLIAPQEAVSRLEALRAYTVAGTRLTREEALKGTIEAGKLADLAVLDRDFFRIPKDQIKDVQVDMTVVGGGRWCGKRLRAPNTSTHSSPCTHSPPTIVPTTSVSRIAIGSIEKMSCDSTAKSATLPGARLPLSASSPLAKAAPTV